MHIDDDSHVAVRIIFENDEPDLRGHQKIDFERWTVKTEDMFTTNGWLCVRSASERREHHEGGTDTEVQL